MAVKIKERDGKYWLYIDYNGKRKAKKVGSEKAALDAAAKIEAKITLGQFEIKKEEKKRRTFKTYFENWLDTYVKAECKERTYDLYSQLLRLYLLPTFGQQDITTITREEVKKWAYDLLAQGKSRNTVKAALIPMAAMFNAAVEYRHIVVNPATRILRRNRKERAESQQKMDFFTREELALLLTTCQEHFADHYPFVLLLGRTGLRIGEAFGLQWGDIDWQSRNITVQRTWSNRRLGSPKSGKSRRVDMSLQLTEVLKALLLERKKETLKRGWGTVPEWVFTNQENHPLEHSHFHARVWVKLLKKAGLRHTNPHTLRHTYASLLIQNGESLVYVKDQMGHASIQITVDCYGHLVPGGNRAAADRLDDLKPQPSATQTQPVPQIPLLLNG